MTLLPLDYVLAAVGAVLLLTGLIKGASGEIGMIAALAATVAGECFAWPLLVDSMSRYAAYGTAAVGGIILFWLVRSLVAKCLSVAIGQPMNALLGLLAGVVQCAAIVAVLIGVGFAPAGNYSQTPLVSFSNILQRAAEFADANASNPSAANHP